MKNYIFEAIAYFIVFGAIVNIVESKFQLKEHITDSLRSPRNNIISWTVTALKLIYLIMLYDIPLEVKKEYFKRLTVIIPILLLLLYANFVLLLMPAFRLICKIGRSPKSATHIYSVFAFLREQLMIFIVNEINKL